MTVGVLAGSDKLKLTFGEADHSEINQLIVRQDCSVSDSFMYSQSNYQCS